MRKDQYSAMQFEEHRRDREASVSGSTRTGVEKGVGELIYPNPGSQVTARKLWQQIFEDYYAWHRKCTGGLHPTSEGPHALPGDCAAPGSDVSTLRQVLEELSGRLSRSSVPWPSPMYMAHMTGDTPLAASLAYVCGLLYNPNNVTPEASPVTTELEHEVSDDLCRLLGYAPRGWAHLSSGGHSSNYEAIWIARNLRAVPQALARHPHACDLVSHCSPTALVNLGVDEILNMLDAVSDRGIRDEVLRLADDIRSTGGLSEAKLLIARNAHYAWRKCVDLLGLGARNAEWLDVDDDHRMDLNALRTRVHDLIRQGQPIVAIVACAGSSGEGSVDDLDGIVRLRDECERLYGASFYIHVDAAFGGYCRSLCLDPGGEMLSYDEVSQHMRPAALKREVYEAFRALPQTDSTTVDPHKNGHIPYPAGALALRDRRLTSLIGGATALYFGRSNDKRLPFGPHTLEGARPGAAAAAVWATHQVIRPDRSGYGQLLAGCLATTQELHRRCQTTGELHVMGKTFRLVSHFESDLNILNLSIESTHPLPNQDADELNLKILNGLRDEALADPYGQPWVSSNELAARSGGPSARLHVLRLCVMQKLDPPTLDAVWHALLNAIARQLAAALTMNS
ncbi:pyridoxal phosphate-dependent decarboxylase family protein [Streptomyces erythrochromogenes]|uniref:pyridoxal phosphate-dependent decarboxylase family protein n=1 Tax=Streptomyces erythrochromogenes TaxID=285574 RepID=UPI0033CEDCA3